MLILNIIKSRLGFLGSLVLSRIGVYVILGLLATYLWYYFPKGTKLPYFLFVLFLVGLIGGFIAPVFWIFIPFLFGAVIVSWILFTGLTALIKELTLR